MTMHAQFCGISPSTCGILLTRSKKLKKKHSHGIPKVYIGKGFRGYVEDKTERSDYKISTKFNEVILIFPSTELQKDETSIDFGSQTLNISCTIEFIIPYLVGVSNNGRGTQKNLLALTRTHFKTPLS